MVGVAALVIDVERHVGRFGQLAAMGERQVAAELTIGKTLSEGEASAGGGERLEAEALKITRGADVPRIGNDETSGLVELAKGAAFVGDAGAGGGHGGKGGKGGEGGKGGQGGNGGSGGAG